MKMKKMIGILLMVTLFLNLMPLQIFANSSDDMEKIAISEDAEVFLKDGEINSLIYKNDVYEYNTYIYENFKITEISLENEILEIVKFDLITNEIYVNEEKISIITEKYTSSKSSYSNWSAPTRTRYTLDVAGKSYAAILIILNMAGAGTWSGAAAWAIETLASHIYYESITSYNYVDYGYKVGYRLTERIYNNSSYDKIIHERYMSGSR